jgi:pimeloyl-ACP methyl ester carboxylesterase
MRILLGMMLACTISAASVDGIDIHWTSAGKGGKTVILVHGWTGDESAWSAQVPALVAAKYRVITLDLPGHGKSGLPKDGKFSMDLFARAIESVRAEAGANRVALVGHSMGTPVIRQYARLYPKRTLALVFADGVVMKPEDGLTFATLAPRFAGPDGPKNHEQFVRAMCVVTPDEMRTNILKVSMATPEATVSGAMAALGDPAIWKEDVIDIPVLGIYADKSKLADREIMHRVFPKLEYVEIPGTDHFLMMEKPEEFNRYLLDFLKKHS